MQACMHLVLPGHGAIPPTSVCGMETSIQCSKLSENINLAKFQSAKIHHFSELWHF